MRLVTLSSLGQRPQPGVLTADGAVLAVRAALGDDAPASVANLPGRWTHVCDRLGAALARASLDPDLAGASGLRVHPPRLRSGHAARAEDAANFVAGYTILNDVSARDAWAELAAAHTADEGRRAWIDMTAGKQLPTFAPMGPAVVTADDVDASDLRLTTTVNGQLRQNAFVGELLVDIAHPHRAALASLQLRARPRHQHR